MAKSSASVPRKQDYADLSHVIRRAEVGAQAPSGVAEAPTIEGFLSHSNLESPLWKPTLRARASC